MPMSHNRALVSKTDINNILRRIKVKAGDPEPTTSDPDLEWLVIQQNAEPVYDNTIEKLDVSFAKVDGKYDISYTKVIL